MSNFSNVLKVIGVIVGVILVGLLIGWLGTSGRQPASQPSTSVPPAENTGEKAVDSRPSSVPSVPPTEIITHQSPTPVTPASADLITNWSDKLDQILTSNSDEADKGKQLLEMFPRLPEDGQVEVARHLANLLPDQDYPALAKYFADAKTPEAVLDVLLADALNRPNSVKLPLLLEVARQPDHPKAGEARDLLELFLEENYGNDWSQWESKLGQWLKDNPD